jgi:methylmalonyl-CoA mutase N-terminal domain/subunit
VGVNRFVSDEPPPETQGYEMDAVGRQRQLDRLNDIKATRDSAAVRRSLAVLSDGARGTANLMPLLIECAKSYCTVGEMVRVLKDEWGGFVQPRAF